MVYYFDNLSYSLAYYGAPLFCLSLSFGFGGLGDSQREFGNTLLCRRGLNMKVIIEVNSSEDFDYEYFIDWLNDKWSDSNMSSHGVPSGIKATIVSVDRENRY